MDNNSSISNSKYPFLVKLASFLGVLFVLDSTFGMLLKPYFDAPVTSFYERYSAIQGLHDNADVIFTGDSQTQHGVNTPLFSTLCDCHAQNISIPGTSFITTFYSLRDYIESNKKPKLVVIQTSIGGMVMPPTGESQLVIEQLPIRDQLYYLVHSFDVVFLMRKFVSTYRYREGFQRLLRSDKTVPPYAKPIDGYLPLSGELATTTNAASSPEQLLETPIDQIQLLYLEKILALLHERGINTITVQPPEYITSFSKIGNLPKINNAITEKVEKLKVMFYNFDIPDSQLVKQANVFSDEKHLNAKGAAIYTRKLWEIIRKYLIQ